MSKSLQIKKRNGKLEPFDIDKIHRVIEWAIKDLDGVSLSDIEINVNLNMKDGIGTEEIHDLLTESAANLISLAAPNYQYVASRLLNYQLRKSVWGGKNPCKLADFIKDGIAKKIYDPEFLQWYTKDEINKIDEFVDHDRDLTFTYASIRQLCEKYLIQNRETKQILETPQVAYILIAMALFHRYGEDRLTYVRRAYNYFSKHKINLPTPIMAGVRTTMRSFASCMLIQCGDSMDSIFATASAVGHATSRRYGIGIDMGALRSINTPVRGGEVIHTGVVPFLKVMESTVKSCHQNSVRGGGATVTFPIWHSEIESILQLKNNAGTDDSRVRKLDYSIALSKLFYERFLKNETITLFSPHEVPELTASFGLPEFDELYLKAEKNRAIKYKKTVSARSVFALRTKEHIETGRIYLINVDHANSHGSWKKQVRMSNLCQEVTHCVTPLKSLDDPNGEIGVCILAAVNWLEIQSEAEHEKVCDVIVRMLDELIDYQDYFNQAARNFATKRRSIGVGLTNYAAFLAKYQLRYDDKAALKLTDEWIERQQFYLLKASVLLAKTKGAADLFVDTKYSEGVFPLDTYKKDVDEIVSRKPTCDWDWLRAEVKQYGLRHSTVSCQMPVESSSVIQNATNGIEPPRSLISYKKSKSQTVPMLVPHAAAWGDRYTLAFERESNLGYLNICAVLQKWIDMAISVNLYYNYPLEDATVIKDTLYHYKMGGKTIYYINTNDGNKHDLEGAVPAEEACPGGSCVL